MVTSNLSLQSADLAPQFSRLLSAPGHHFDRDSINEAHEVEWTRWLNIMGDGQHFVATLTQTCVKQQHQCRLTQKHGIAWECSAGREQCATWVAAAGSTSGLLCWCGLSVYSAIKFQEFLLWCSRTLGTACLGCIGLHGLHDNPTWSSEVIKAVCGRELFTSPAGLNCAPMRSESGRSMKNKGTKPFAKHE